MLLISFPIPSFSLENAQLPLHKWKLKSVYTGLSSLLNWIESVFITVTSVWLCLPLPWVTYIYKLIELYWCIKTCLFYVRYISIFKNTWKDFWIPFPTMATQPAQPYLETLLTTFLLSVS